LPTQSIQLLGSRLNIIRMLGICQNIVFRRCCKKIRSCIACQLPRNLCLPRPRRRSGLPFAVNTRARQRSNGNNSCPMIKAYSSALDQPQPKSVAQNYKKDLPHAYVRKLSDSLPNLFKLVAKNKSEMIKYKSDIITSCRSIKYMFSGEKFLFLIDVQLVFKQ
jgi:hypothetical protein